MSLSFPEISLIFGLVFLMGLECFKALQSGSWVQVYRPTLFIAVFLRPAEVCLFDVLDDDLLFFTLFPIE